MDGAPPRLGDLIDDYCPRCRLLLNHAVASLVGDQVAKVICQTCLSEHAYLHEKEPQKKKPGGGRETLFDQVLAKVSPAEEEDDPPPEPKKKTTVAANTRTLRKAKPSKSKK
jgi:hypothetical protein